MTMILSALTIYPVKSCRGISVSSAQLNDWGLEFDRNWMVVTAEGRFITQREMPSLALVETAITEAALHLQAPGFSPLRIPLSPAAPDPIEVIVWRDHVQAIDQGTEAQAWFSDYLHTECRLVRIPSDFDRLVNRQYSPQPAQVGFADGYPLLVISEASLTDLNQRLPDPIPMNRFRPNLVVSGCAAFAEDTWQRIRIGQIEFDGVKPCARCVITTTNQQTGERLSKEPLKTLATYRLVQGEIMFGQNLIHRAQGRIRVGDPVVSLSISA